MACVKGAGRCRNMPFSIDSISPGFAHMQLAATGSYMGIRESRRIIGEYTLTYDDYKARRRFPDQIVIYC